MVDTASMKKSPTEEALPEEQSAVFYAERGLDFFDAGKLEEAKIEILRACEMEPSRFDYNLIAAAVFARAREHERSEFFQVVPF